MRQSALATEVNKSGGDRPEVIGDRPYPSRHCSTKRLISMVFLLDTPCEALAMLTHFGVDPRGGPLPGILPSRGRGG